MRQKLSYPSCFQELHLCEEFTIANRGVPVAKLVPYKDTESKGDKPLAWLTLRVPGRLAGQIQISDDFNKTDEELIDLFYGDINDYLFKY